MFFRKKIYEQISSEPKIYFVNLPQKTDEVYFEIILKTGHANETDEEYGVGHLLEHYLIDELENSKKVENGRLNAHVRFENTKYILNSKREGILSEAESFAKYIFAPGFENIDTFTKAKKVVENEKINKNATNYQECYEIVMQERFGDFCGYARKTKTEIDNLPSKTIIDIKNYHEKYYTLSNVLFVIYANNLNSRTKESILDLIKHFTFNKGQEAKDINKCNYSQFKIIKNNEVSTPNEIYAAISFPSLSSENKTAPRIIVDSLFETFTDNNENFFKNIRSAGIYKIDSDKIFLKKFGLVSFAVYSNNQQAIDFLEAFKNHVPKIKARGVEKKILAQEKEKAIKNSKNAFKNNYDFMDWVTYDLLNYGEVITPEDDKKAIELITNEDVKEMANKIFDFSKANIILIGKKVDEIDESKIKEIFGQ